jgi:MSHA pilin protein MshC
VSVAVQVLERQHGFTLIELIAVIVIAGILAITAASTFNRRDYDGAAAAERIRSYVSFAQKTAVAARRATRVQVNGAGAIAMDICRESMSSTDVCPTPGTNWIALVGPDGLATLASPSGVTFSAGSAIHFDSLGRPASMAGVADTAAKTILVTSSTVLTLTIDPETGYARY